VSGGGKPETVGVVGLGAMGGALAERLIAAGEPVAVHDVDADAVARLRARGARATGIDAVADCGTVLTCLPTAADLDSVLVGEGLLERLGGALLAETSTVLPATVRELAARAAEHRVEVVDCPVSGGPEEARAGTLTVLAGADGGALERARPVLERLGRVEHVGRVGDGKAIKLVNNAMSMGNVVVAMEAFMIGVAHGLDRERMVEVLGRSGGRSHHFAKRMPRVLADDFESGFAIRLGEKDLRLVLEAAHAVDCPVPVAACVHQLLEIARATGLADLDVAAVVKLYEGWAAGDSAQEG